MNRVKAVRNRVANHKPVQAAVRVGARSGIVPRKAYERFPALGLHPVDTPGGNRFLYDADISDMMARQVVWGNLRVWEASSLSAFSKLVRTSRRFVDVGAYTGVYSLIACADGPGEVIAFEPNVSVMPLLRRNIEINRLGERISVIPSAVSDKPGVATLAVPSDVTAARLDDCGTGARVEVTTLDAVLNGLPVDIIKIDVEGLEPNVVKGAEASIHEYHPAIIAECLTHDSFSILAEGLAALGYSRCRHLGSRRIVDTDAYIDEPAFANFLWTAGSRP